MECRALPFRQLPHQSSLFLDFFDDFPRVAKFYGQHPTLEAVIEAAHAMMYPPERRSEVAAALRAQNARFGAGDAARANLERFANGAVAVLSGQQVGLFGGPAYALYKAVSAVHIAQELTNAGVNAVPIFWMATEDHDLEEVRHSTWFHGGKLTRFELAESADAGKPVGQIALGPAVQEMAEQAADILRAAGGEFLAGILRESYGSQETYGSAFGKLFARLFSEQGLILLDPLDPRLRPAGSEVLRRAVAKRDEVMGALLARNKELENADYAAQVKVTARSTLLFYMGGGEASETRPGERPTGRGVRRPITASGGKFVCGELRWTTDELLAAIKAEPENFSANALLRPVVQDYLLPTAAYIGGPAEVAYFAQAEVIYKKLLGRMTVILPRASFTLVDGKVEKLLRRYGLQVEDVWRGSQELRRKMETASVPKTLAKKFAAAALDAERKLAALKREIVQLDRTLAGAVETARKKISFQLEKLKRKAGKAEAFKAGLINGHQEFLESALYPHKTEQSRELCFLPFLAQWGPGAMKELVRAAGCGKAQGHKILRVP